MNTPAVTRVSKLLPFRTRSTSVHDRGMQRIINASVLPNESNYPMQPAIRSASNGEINHKVALSRANLHMLHLLRFLNLI